MIGVTREPAFRAEGQHHLRPKSANLKRQLIHHPVKVLAMEITVGIVSYDPVGDLQNLTGGGKLPAPHRGQLLIILGSATMGGCLTRRKANDRGLDAPLMVKSQRTAESSGLIIRMGRDA